MKIGIIAPIKMLGNYCNTPIQYCLPSLLVESEAYRHFYLSKRKVGNYTIILDCRKPGWKREPEEFKIVIEALRIFHPDFMVAPSYMFKAKESSYIYEEFTRQFPLFKKKIVRCVEGTSLEEAMIFPHHGSTIAVPSHMYRYLDGISLPPKIIYIENHLNVEELAGRKGILVTSLPVRLGLQGRLISDYRPSPNSLTFNEIEDLYPKIVTRNIRETLEFYEEQE